MSNTEHSADWILVHSRPMEKEERKDFAERIGCDVEDFDEDDAVIFTSQLPDYGQEVITCNKWGTIRIDTFFYDDDGCYKEYYGIKYSDAYEVYGLTRTGCCGCPISSKAVADLEKIRPYEPQLVKAAWNVFGPSYEYRQKYNEYRDMRNAEKKALRKTNIPEGQMRML